VVKRLHPLLPLAKTVYKLGLGNARVSKNTAMAAAEFLNRLPGFLGRCGSEDGSMLGFTQTRRRCWVLVVADRTDRRENEIVVEREFKR